jgi:uncharacterized SAM-binding protein YcdF (DUF218 family)
MHDSIKLLSSMPMVFKRFLYLAVLGILLTIPTRLALAYAQFPQPQAILVLGGAHDREAFTARFARVHLDIPIWVSSGIPTHEARVLFKSANISENRLHFDRRATDTVTNFTTLVNDLESAGIHHLYLITSDYHMARARAIATLILGSRGIAFTPVSIPSPNFARESHLRILRDAGRSLLWLTTGRTGADFNTRYS